MSIIINTNISSMQGIRALNKSTGSLNQALERLSTGYRINSSKDDAAGCAISTSLNKDISSLVVAQNNAQMGQSMIDTANGSLSNISNLLQRMRDLTEQAANGTYGTDERSAMQNEIDNLLSEMNRAKNSTEFNGKQIFGKAITSEEDAIKQGYTVVKTAEELQTKLTTSADCKVMLFADIDLSELDEVDGSNWTAVGTSSIAFKGTLDGNGFTISNLKINKGDTDNQGLIGTANGATIKNVNLENAEVTGKQYTGGLVGRSTNHSNITNCSVSGSIIGTDTRTGGLIGELNKSSIINCSSSANVTGNDRVGGLVGENNNSIIENSESSAYVKGNTRVGGLVGINYYSMGLINNCTSTGTVTGKNGTGGLVGVHGAGATITNSKTTSNVTEGTNTGAFVGRDEGGDTIYKDNEYNSTINDGMRAVSNIVATPEQVLDNENLKIATNSSYGSKLSGLAFGVGVDTTCNLQVGIKDDSYSTIQLDTGLAWGELNIDLSTETTARTALERIDTVMSKITNKQTELGAMSNRLTSAIDYQMIQKNANTATLSLIKDADFAQESSNYIKAQILQQTTASLLATANQNPSIALMLVTGTNLRK